jgi:poly-beta-1,6-N-acetyl-D-glucosamine biosynthesis protein PgaD
MKTPAPSDPDWPPIIDSRKLGPIIRVRDTMLTVIAWIFLVLLLWELCVLLWDYFSYPIFELSRTHRLNWQAFVDRIGGFALFSLLLVLWLSFWGFLRRKELRRTHDRRPVSPLALSDHAAIFGIPPETIERWRQSQVVVVQFDASNRLANITAKTPAPPSVDPEDLGKDKLRMS